MNKDKLIIILLSKLGGYVEITHEAIRDLNPSIQYRVIEDDSRNITKVKLIKEVDR